MLLISPCESCKIFSYRSKKRFGHLSCEFFLGSSFPFYLYGGMWYLEIWRWLLRGRGLLTKMRKQGQILRDLTLILKEVKLWAKSSVVLPATEKSLMKGRVNLCGRLQCCLILGMSTATPTFSNHPDQSATIIFKASLSTSKKLTISWRLKWGLAFFFF